MNLEIPKFGIKQGQKKRIFSLGKTFAISHDDRIDSSLLIAT